MTMTKSPSRLLLAALTLAASLAVLGLALTPALALAGDGFQDVCGRYEFSDGRAMYVGGTPRRPTLTDDDGSVIELAPLRDGTMTSADGRIELHFMARPNGIVTAMRLTRHAYGDVTGARLRKLRG